MTTRHFLVQIALGVAVLIGANLVVQRLSSSSVPRQLLRKADGAAQATDLFFGNSTMAAGLSEEAFVAAAPGRRALNLGLGASSAVEHHLIYRQQSKHGGATVYYGFFDRGLTDASIGGWDTLVGNRAMAYYIEPEIAFRFYAEDAPIRRFSLQLVGQVPALVERYAIWAKVEVVRRVLGEIGMPSKETNRFGRAEDFALLEQDQEEFIRQCSQAVDDRVPLSGPVAAMFQLAKERGGSVIVVEMPMPQGHRQRYYASSEWRAYRTHVMQLVHDAGGTYVRAADWMDDADFADHLHVNQAGANAFSRRLGLNASGPK